MFSKLEFLLAFRFLRSKRKEGFISVTAIFSFLGIMIGVATLIIVMSVMNGFRFELVNRILGINAHLSIFSRQGKIVDYENIVKEVSALPGIVYANPIIEGQAMIVAGKSTTGGMVKGISPSDLVHKKLIASNIKEGSISTLQNKSSVLIGSAIANNYQLKTGDLIKIISAELNDTIIGSIPRIKTYQIGGIFESGMYEYDSSTVFIPFETAQIHFRYPNSTSAIEIFVGDPLKLDQVKYELQHFLASKYPDLSLMDWQDSNSSFIDALKVERTVMFLILTLIILVAAFNIISSMIMLVNDKTKSIALLRTLGMSKGSVMRVFLIAGSSIGFIGTALGFIIGVLFSANINRIKHWLESMTGTSLFNPTVYFLTNLPSKVFISDVVLIVSIASILSFLATIYPAYKASKSSPAELLRYN